jgi:K+-sensing histidine kinase KdpD
VRGLGVRRRRHDDRATRLVELVERDRAAVVVIAAVVPALACAAIAPFREDIANTNAALVLVLVVVAVAATGLRWAGVVAALSSAAGFDFFLTQPYYRLTITDRADIETAALLTLVGLAVTEVALWGRRQQARASRQQGYLDGVVQTAGIVAAGNSRTEALIEHVAGQLVDVLGVDDCHFDSDTRDVAPAVIVRDGTVVHHGRDIDVERCGLPTDCEIELRVQHDGMTRGRFLLIASTRIARPSYAQRQVAVALADQVGAALATHDGLF